MAAFAAYALGVACLAAFSIRSKLFGAGLGLWLLLTGILAASGALSDFHSFPPPVLGLVALASLTTILTCASRAGGACVEHLSLSGLIAFQAFRLPLELIMHEAAREGVMPSQMTFTGRNFDIVTGLLALVVAAWVARHPQSRAIAWLWNLAGLGLLINVVGVAILSFPGPYRVFMQEPANVWIGHFPFVWLPTVLVQLALGGHILIARKLLAAP